MKARQPIIVDDDHRVIPFRPRSALERRAAGTRPRPANDLSDEATHEHGGEADDFHQRMLANLAAFAFTALLTGIGIWLASSLAEHRQAQDCALTGRRDCAPWGSVALPPR